MPEIPNKKRNVIRDPVGSTDPVGPSRVLLAVHRFFYTNHPSSRALSLPARQASTSNSDILMVTSGSYLYVSQGTCCLELRACCQH